MCGCGSKSLEQKRMEEMRMVMHKKYKTPNSASQVMGKKNANPKSSPNASKMTKSTTKSSKKKY